MRKDAFVYISGPIKPTLGHSVERNVSDALVVFLDLLRRGIPAFCPHLGAAFPSAHSEIGYETWMEYDFAVIDRCTHVFMMTRWAESKGAVREHDYAIDKGISVHCSYGFLLEDIEGKERP